MKLTIVTVTLNNLAGLRRTWHSVVCQTWRDFEWIVVDGGSDDGSVDFLESLSEQPQWWVSERDSGVYNAMNKGVRHANGHYVIFMNAGDVFHSDSTLDQIFKNDLQADVLYGDWMRVYVNRKELCKSPSPLYPFYFFCENICQQAMFVKTQLLKESGFNESYRIAGDLAKWRQMMLEGRSFCYVPVVVCDFEAASGLSETYTSLTEADLNRLKEDFPVGLTIQGESLRGYFQDFQAVQRLRQSVVARCVILFEKRFVIWRRQGIVQTFKNFFITLKHLFTRK